VRCVQWCRWGPGAWVLVRVVSIYQQGGVVCSQLCASASCASVGSVCMALSGGRVMTARVMCVPPASRPTQVGFRIALHSRHTKTLTQYRIHERRDSRDSRDPSAIIVRIYTVRYLFFYHSVLRRRRKNKQGFAGRVRSDVISDLALYDQNRMKRERSMNLSMKISRVSVMLQ
jgi:hypothetical protein